MPGLPAAQERRARDVRTADGGTDGLGEASKLKRRRASYQQGADSSYSPLDLKGNGTVSSHFFIEFLHKSGLDIHDDPRLAQVRAALQALGAIEEDLAITFEELEECTCSCRNIIRKCMAGLLRVPDFEGFAQIFQQVYHEVLPERGGANAAYIPELANVDPEQFAIAVCTIDGQRFAIGDSKKQFCIQSCSKPVTYLMAERRFGHEYVHDHVGHEPSGQRFNQMVLKDAPKPEMKQRQVPHNPLINAGAIMCTSMVDPDTADEEERLESLLGVWRELSGYPAEGCAGCPLGFDQAVYQSESATADRNWCLGYMMKEKGSFPPCFTSLKATLELYFKTCAILSTTEAMANAAATLANGGLCPLSGRRVFNADAVRRVLPIMLTCGMYDYSGEWAYQIGVPSKSGVGGCIFLVVPNVCGIAVWSPRLDEIGNSVRGVAAAKRLASCIRMHTFELFASPSSSKLNPVEPRYAERQRTLGEIIFAATVGDVHALEYWHNAGADIYQGDYDQRTALHLAAAEGHENVVRFLLDHALADQRGQLVRSQDRWGGTPLDDATRGGHVACAVVLELAGGSRGSIAHMQVGATFEQLAPEEKDVVPTIFAAARGDLMELIRINASGRCQDLFAGDYDRRTALHLAAAEGHLDVLRYLLRQAPPERRAQVLDYRGRFGNTPLLDAERSGHAACAEALRLAAK